MTEELLEMLDKSVTQFHTVKKCEEKLENKGYACLSHTNFKDIKPHGKYYAKFNDSMLVAFSASGSVRRIKIGIAHTDFPCLKVKCNPDMKREGYHTINVEPYGGLLTESWFDRPLGIAGRVIVEGSSAFEPKTILYNSDRPLLTVPNLAPHLNRSDEKKKVDFQKEFIPIFNSTIEDGLIHFIADEINVKEEDILDYDLYLYNADKPIIMGKDSRLLSSPRIDDLSSVSALLEVLDVIPGEGDLNIQVFFDNEEIGSRSKQGADSMMLRDIVENILSALNVKNEELLGIYEKSFMISLDVAHATHPNYAEKSDPTNPIMLGRGAVLKTSASQRYVTDSRASAIIKKLAKDKGFKIQSHVNKSGMPGGQTLGPIISSYLPILATDIGIPVLSMHSARELASLDDYEELCKCVNAVFSN